MFFPLTLPAFGAGAILVFILTLGFYITPAILGGGRVPMIANMLDLLINQLPNWELAAAISTLLLLLASGCWSANAFSAAATATGSSPDARSPAGNRGGGRGPARRCGSTWPDAGAHRAGLRRGVGAGVPDAADHHRRADVVLERGVTLIFPPPGFSLRWYQSFFADAAWRRRR